MVKKNKKKLLNKRGQMNIPDPAVTVSQAAAPPEQTLFTFDAKTKETMIASITALVIAQMIIFFGDFLVGGERLSGVIYALIFALLGGAVSGFILAKFYDQLMGFVSNQFKFLLPFSNTFFKLLFVPVVIGSIIGLLLGLLTGGAMVIIGAIMRKLVHIIYGVLKGGKPFDAKTFFEKVAKQPMPAKLKEGDKLHFYIKVYEICK